ncbi:MAG: sulfatase-like hydrolase/transferase, partial [Verrucomicrobiota bacterium]
MKKLIIGTLLVTGLCLSAFARQSQPNIIFILADDLGYGDLSCYGQTKFETPNIDALAENGMKFTQHYSGSTVCAPARCSLLTGFHTGHTAVRGNNEVRPEGQAPMPKDTYTIASFLQKAGYETGIFGKWGLGYPGSGSEPKDMGFDRFYGYNCQRIAHSYYPAFLWNDDERELLWGNVASHTRDYAPDLIHDQAIKFIVENKDQPFFLYYAAIQPHADMIAPEEYMEKFRGKYLPESVGKAGGYIAQPEAHTAFAAMVNVLDEYVGEVMAELEKQGIADNTLVIFTSDNGP